MPWEMNFAVHCGIVVSSGEAGSGFLPLSAFVALVVLWLWGIRYLAKDTAAVSGVTRDLRRGAFSAMNYCLLNTSARA